MTNIYNFPGKDAAKAVPMPDKASGGFYAKGKSLPAALVRFVWVVTVLVWPVLKWVLSIEVFFQLLRAFYYWDDPGSYAGWTFLMHFAALTAVTYFVSFFKPKGL